MRNVAILLLLIVLGIFAGNLPVQAQHDTSTDDAVEHFNKGNAFYGEGKYDEAIEQFKKALDHNPKDASSHFGLGNSYFLKKDYDTALKHYGEVVKLKPDYSKVHYAMGLAYRRLGKKDEAQKAFERYNNLSKMEKVEPSQAAKKPTGEAKVAEKERPKVTPVEEKPAEAGAEKKPVEGKEPTEERQLEGRKWEERPEDRQLESRAWDKKPEGRQLESKVGAGEGPSAQRITPKKGEAKGEIKGKPAVKKIEPKEKKDIAKRPEKQVKEEKVERKRDVLKSLWNSSPVGKIFLGLIAYTFIAQVWLGFVVLVCLIFLWRKR